MANRSASARKRPAPCQSVVPADTTRRCSRYPFEALTSTVPVCHQHGRRRCYPNVPIAARLFSACYSTAWLIARKRTAFAAFETSYFAIQAIVVSRSCSAFLRGYEHAVKSKVAVLQVLSRQTHSITHSLTASVTHHRQLSYIRRAHVYVLGSHFSASEL